MVRLLNSSVSKGLFIGLVAVLLVWQGGSALAQPEAPGVEPAESETSYQDFDAARASASDTAVASIPVDPAKPPKIVFETIEVDLGEVAEGEAAKFTFPFKNEGKGDLEILDVKKTCGCTKAESTQKILKPGESAAIVGEVDTRGRPGKQRKSIRVQSNDPENPMNTLIFQVQVRQEVEVDPSNVTFRNLDIDQPGTEEVRILNHTTESLRITSIRTTPDNRITAKLISPLDKDNPGQSAPVKGPDQPIVLEVSVAPSSETGPFSGVVSIDTDNPKKPKVQVHVSGRVSGDLEAYPQGVYFGMLKDNTPTTKTVNVSSRSGIQFKIKSIDVGDLPVDVRYEVLETKEGYRLKVGVRGDTSDNRIAGKIKVLTDHPKQNTLEIPITAFIRR